MVKEWPHAQAEYDHFRYLGSFFPSSENKLSEQLIMPNNYNLHATNVQIEFSDELRNRELVFLWLLLEIEVWVA